MNIYNCHTHIFTSANSPNDLLKTRIPNNGASKIIKFLLDSTPLKELPVALAKLYKVLAPNSQAMLANYANFLRVGLLPTQLDILNEEVKSFQLGSDNWVFSVLTLNLDYMSEKGGNFVKYQEQLRESVFVKAKYPNQVKLFLSVDPRTASSNTQLLEQTQGNWNKYENAFSGLKFYPAMGYFPSDTRLDGVYAWAAENQIPITTHVTRGGNFYVGDMRKLLADTSHYNLPANTKCADLINAVTLNINNGAWKKDENRIGTQLFTNPEHFKTALENNPNLKINFAHFGGSNEVNNGVNQTGIPGSMIALEQLAGLTDFTTNIISLINKYDNVYTDLSYTICDNDALKKVAGLAQNHPKLNSRLLFGTDSFLVLMEGNLSKMIANSEANLGNSLFHNSFKVNPITFFNPY